ncbi:MAG: hypothetical protein ABIG93_00125 [archaeon]
MVATEIFEQYRESIGLALAFNSTIQDLLRMKYVEAEAGGDPKFSGGNLASFFFLSCNAIISKEGSLYSLCHVSLLNCPYTQLEDIAEGFGIPLNQLEIILIKGLDLGIETACLDTDVKIVETYVDHSPQRDIVVIPSLEEIRIYNQREFEIISTTCFTS